MPAKKGMKNAQKYTAQMLIDAVPGTMGVVSAICSKVGCDRGTFYNYHKENPELQAAVLHEREQMKDFAEGRLFTHIREGNIPALLFFLKTQARDRGYIETLRLEGQIQVNLVNETIKALEDAGINAEEFFQRAIDRANAHKVLKGQ